MNLLKQILNPRSQNTQLMIIRIVQSTAIISAVIVLIIAIAMIANYFQMKSVDPLHSPALEKLLNELDKNPDDTALKEEIRSLDLLARKANFTSQWQLRTGGVILIVAVAVLVLSLKTLSTLNKKLPVIKDTSSDVWQKSIRARTYISAAGILLVIIAVLFGIFSQNKIESNSNFNINSPSFLPFAVSATLNVHSLSVGTGISIESGFCSSL